MLSCAEYMDIKELQREGLSLRAIARRLGMSRNTVRKHLRAGHPPQPMEIERSSLLEPYHEHLRKRYEEYGLSAVRLVEEVRAMGYPGGVDQVRRFLRKLREDKCRSGKLTVRFETAPGDQAQVDWQYAGVFQTPAGETVKVYAFVMVLGYSRAIYVHFTTSMALPVLLLCHEKAFEFFGGIPRNMLYDNMKQVRVGPGQLNVQLLDFAVHHGFSPRTHRAYRPRTKGKVERAIRYMDGSLLVGRTFTDLNELNAFTLSWCTNTANQRIHATTQAKPADLLATEGLTPMSCRYPFIEERSVDAQSFVNYRGSRYSVPPKHVLQTVMVSGVLGRVTVRLGDVIIAEHKEAAVKGQSVADEAHIAEAWRLSVPEEGRKAPPRWNLTFNESVPQRSLKSYEEECA